MQSSFSVLILIGPAQRFFFLSPLRFADCSTEDIEDVRSERVEADETRHHDEDSPGLPAAPQSDGGSQDDVQSEGVTVH